MPRECVRLFMLGKSSSLLLLHLYSRGCVHQVKSYVMLSRQIESANCGCTSGSVPALQCLPDIPEFCMISICHLYISIHAHLCMRALAYIKEREHYHPCDSPLKRKFNLGAMVSTAALFVSKILISVLMTYMSLR